MGNGSLETLQGREVCWTGQVYHLSLACGDPAAFAVKWYKTNLIIHFLFHGRTREAAKAHSSLALPGSISEMTAVSPVMQRSRGRAVQALRGHPTPQPLSCLPHARVRSAGSPQPLSTPWSRNTTHRVHPRSSQCSQPDIKYSAGTKLPTEASGPGSWARLFCLSGLRETCPYYALPAARTAQCAGKGQRMKQAMELLQRLFLSLPCRSEYGQNCTLVIEACQKLKDYVFA